MKDWLVHQTRVTLFTTELLKPAESSSDWQGLVGSLPEVDEYVRPQNLRRQVGPYESGILELTLQIPRIDWIFSPIPSGPGAFPTLGRLNETIDPFLKRVVGWVDTTSLEYKRVALGVSLLSRAKDLIDGYKSIVKLAPTLKLNVGKDEISDLFFQINRPVQSKKNEAVTFNRLMKWSVISTKFFQITNVDDGAISLPSEFYCRLELDINTKPDPDLIFNRSHIAPILKEAQTIAEGIAAKGEKA